MKPILLALTLLFTTLAHTQSFDSLQALPQGAVKTYFSKGHELRAKAIAARCERAFAYGVKALGVRPEVTLLVLSPEDWSRYTNFPVYGMPHYADKKTLIVATSNNAFWKSFELPVDALPDDLAKQVKAIYVSGGAMSMQPFFDLLALHELGHAFHIQGGVTMPRKWMGELFCNIFLHTYIAETEKEALPALTLFPRLVVGAGTQGLTYTTLTDLEGRYAEIGKKHPKNYGWYQCRLHAAAATIYDAGGSAVLPKLWAALKTNEQPMTDEDLAAVLEKGVHPALADVLRNWDRTTKN